MIGTLWLAVSHRRLAALFAGTAFGLVLSVVGVLEITTNAFLANTVLANINPFGLEVLSYNHLSVTHPGYSVFLAHQIVKETIGSLLK